MLATPRGLVSAVVVLALGPALLVARATTPGDEGGGAVMWIAAVLILILVVVVVNVLFQLAGVDVDAARIASHLSAEADQQRLLTRWLTRARWARFVGGFCGVLVWVLGTRTQGDVLLLGTAGIALGAVTAELHHVRARRGPRTVRLDVRSVAQYLAPVDARRMLGVGAAAVVLAVLGAVHGPSRPALAWGVAALLVLVVARAAQHRVARRSRPAVSDALTEADDLARRLAIGRGLAQPATYVSLALVARAAFALEPLLGDAGRVFGFAAWLFALVLWFRNRRLGLDGVLRTPGVAAA